jgi:hypothetical protein
MALFRMSQREIYTAAPLEPESSVFDVQMATET